MVNRMKKKGFYVVGIVMMLVVLAACGGENEDASEGETYVIDYSYVANEESPQHEGNEKFKELVEEKSDGQITVELFPNGQLYSSEVEAYEAVQTGNVEMTMGAAAALAGIDNNFSSIGLPFIFADREAAHEALDGDLGQTLFDGLEDHGMKGLAYAEAGMRQITNNQHPIESVEDLDGLLMRTLENPMHISIFEAVGANASPYAYGELYSALQQNTFHAQDNPIINVIDMRFYEVQDYLTISNHMYTSLPVVINGDFYNDLPEDLQEVLVEAGKEAYDYQRDIAGEHAEEAIAELEGELEITELSDEAVTEFRDAMEPVYTEYREEFGDELMDLIMSYQD
jgi:tripartite ATP-independent transporter DctP family solute receptor